MYAGGRGVIFNMAPMNNIMMSLWLMNIDFQFMNIYVDLMNIYD